MQLSGPEPMLHRGWKARLGELVSPGSYKSGLDLNCLGRQGIEGDTPVRNQTRLLPVTLSTTGHANPVGSREVHLPRLNTLGDR